jgi:hypothetical protein
MIDTGTFWDLVMVFGGIAVIVLIVWKWKPK